jgi:hypothetical protein
MSSRPPLTHVLFMLLAYLAAVLAAAMTMSAIFAFTRSTPPDLANASTITVLLDALDGFAAVSVFAALFIAVFAFPVLLITAAFTEWRAIQRPSVYAFAGMLAAIPLLIAKSADEPNKLAFWLMGLFAGLVGGLVYWAIAGRRSGNWKQLAPKELPA